MAGGLFGPIEVVEGIAIGTGVGQAIGDVVTPKLQEFKNERWTKYPYKPLDPVTGALAAIKGIPSTLNYLDEATKSGYGGEVFGVLEQIQRRFPGTSELLELWRRERLTRAEVDLALERAQIPEPYRAAVLDLFTGRLDPAVIATAIQRGIMRDPGFLPVGPPTGVGKVPRFPVSPLNTLDEAKAHGIDFERLFVETAIVGLPASPDLAARATFRKIIERVDFDRAIAEGNTRNEWADALFEAFREILTSHQYAELQLRGFLTRDERLAETDKHGLSHRDSDLLFDVLGRSINVHQIVTGEARGGTYKPPPDTLAQQEAGIPPAFLASLQRGNLRPEYYDLAYHNRYTYPSFFAIRGLLQGGVFATADAGYEILLEMGWKPSLARIVADFYWRPAGGTATVDPLVKSARTQAITEIRSAYVLGQATADQSGAWLGRLDVPANVQGQMLAVWDVMREVPQKGLTAAQIKKAYVKLPDLWPRARAVDELTQTGLTVDDANTLLDE